MNSLAMKCIP